MPRLKTPFPPMEAATVAEIPLGDEWQYEPKWDGFRCLAFRRGKKIELQAKSGKPLTRYFPDVVAELARLQATQFVLDGEIVIPIGNRLSFNDLLMRIHPAASRIKKLADETPAMYIVFDLLENAKGPLIERPLQKRRRQLEIFAKREFARTKRIVLSPATRDVKVARRWFASAGKALDGIIAKRANMAYRSDDRTGMQKIKHQRTADCVVGGFLYATSGRVVGSLLLGLYDKEGLLHHVGFTSSIARSERAALTRKLEKLIAPPGFTGNAPGGPSRWSTKRSTEWEPLKPKLVVEVEYDHFTGGRFRHGTKFLRGRPDKAPRQCKMEQVSQSGAASLRLLKTRWPEPHAILTQRPRGRGRITSTRFSAASAPRRDSFFCLIELRGKQVMTHQPAFFVSVIVAVLVSNGASARTWSDSTGRYKIDADLIAFNEKSVVLQRADHELGQVPIEKLSQADRDYLKSKEAAASANKLTGAMQTWKLRGGMSIVGRVVGYAQKNITLQRRRGKIYVNDRVFDNLPKIYQVMIPKIVAHFEHLVRDDKQALEDWLVSQQGQPRTIMVDGALVELENGDEYVVPFYFFSDQELSILKPGWDQWLAANTAQQYDQQNNQAFLLQSLMAARQRDQQVQHQIATMQLNQAVLAGATSLWEVTLYPARGNSGPPQWVVGPGVNSAEATRAALAQHPGYVAGPVRKVAGY